MKFNNKTTFNLRVKKGVPKKGFSLVETIIYIALMIVILASLFYLIESASHAYMVLKSARGVERSAINIMNNISEYSSVSTKIDTVETKFNNDQGSISFVNYNDDGSLSTTTKIYVESGRVILAQNGSVVGPISLSDTNVSILKFENMSTSTINGFKVELTIDNASSSAVFISKNFYDSYILR